MHPSTIALLRYFQWAHLPPELQGISRPVCDLAHEMAEKLDGPELTAGLRKLIEAKDCFVRAGLCPEWAIAQANTAPEKES